MNFTNAFALLLVSVAVVLPCRSEEIDKAKLKAQLIKHEGKLSKVYKDSEGIPTSASVST